VSPPSSPAAGTAVPPAPSEPGAGHPPLVALVGPPNSGKTTFFNHLTGLRQKVANYPGVTVEKHLGRVDLPGGQSVDLLDLPGVNGFSGRSLDERVTMDALAGNIQGMRRPDAVVLVVDATRLETQLMLAEPVLEEGLPTLLVLNVIDEFEAQHGSIHDDVLADELGVEVVRTDARGGHGFEQVRSFIAGVAEHRGWASPLGNRPAGEEARVSLPMLDVLTARRRKVQSVLERARYRSPGRSTRTERLDGLVLHKVWGPLVFLAVVALVFQAIFTWAVPLMDGVEGLIALSGGWLADVLPEGWFRSLVVDGVWAGVGSVVVFLPQILILFLFLGLLEDSGYMARAAVIADRSMQRVGLQGRAFLPLLSGYACAIPAILAARTVENERDRLATIFVTPFMTCSARLPVYALLIAAFIPDQPVLGPLLGARALTLLGLYALGIAAAVGTAFLLRRTLLRGQRADFVMELPPYRIPSARSVLYRLWDRSKVFLKRAGTIIFAVTVVLWGLTQFPRVGGGPPPVEESILGTMGQVLEPAIEPLGYDWRVGVGLVSSLAAREVIVGSLGTIYGVQDAGEDSFELQAILQDQMSTATAVSLLVFFVFALQCMSTVAVMRRETAGWKWPVFQFAYMLALAYGSAFVAYRLFLVF
jgi:ferrous iron transport protein B